MYPIMRPAITLRDCIALLNIFAYKREIIRAFERAFADFVGRRYACTCASGRLGIQRILEARGMRGERVAVPAYTCIVVPYAVERSGNIPVFVETRHADALSPDAGELRAHGRTIILTHMFGTMADTAAPTDTFVIEDCCLALGASKDGVRAGTVGDVSVFSFHQSKQLSCVGGGMIATNSEELDALLRASCPYIATWRQELRHVLKAWVLFFVYRRPVYTAVKRLKLLAGKSTDFSLASPKMKTGSERGFLMAQAILGMRQLARYGAIMEQRKRIAEWYDACLSGVPGIRKQPIAPGIAYSHYWVAVPKHRENIRKTMYAAGVNTGIANEYSCPTTPYYAGNHDAAAFRNSTELGERIINLPFYIGLREKDVQFICDVFKRAYADAS